MTPRRLWTALFLLALAALLTACKTVTIPPQVLDCRLWGCNAGQECKPTAKPEYDALYACVNVQPSPSPSPVPTPQPEPDPSPSPSALPTPATPPPSPSPMPVPSPSPTPPPSPEPTPVCVPRPLPPTPVKAVRSDCPKGWPRVTGPAGEPLCFAPSSVPEDGRGPDGCYPCAQSVAYGLVGHGNKDHREDPALVVDKHTGLIDAPGRGESDAYCRRVVYNGTLAYPADSADGWEYGGNCAPRFCAPSPSPAPSASPNPQPTGSPTPFNCNGEWNAPACNMTISRISMSVFYVQRDGQVVQGCKADAKCPAKPGDKVFFNSTPRYDDPRCTRGAAIPNNCVVLPAFAYRAEWTGATRDEGEGSLGYLASAKVTGGGFDVRVCVGTACSPTVTVVVE